MYSLLHPRSSIHLLVTLLSYYSVFSLFTRYFICILVFSILLTRYSLYYFFTRHSITYSLFIATQASSTTLHSQIANIFVTRYFSLNCLLPFVIVASTSFSYVLSISFLSLSIYTINLYIHNIFKHLSLFIPLSLLFHPLTTCPYPSTQYPPIPITRISINICPYFRSYHSVTSHTVPAESFRTARCFFCSSFFIFFFV